MADLRIPTQLPATARATPPARTDAVRAAQRAFFDTALAGEAQAASGLSASAPVEPAAPVPVPREVRAAVDPSAPPPSRSLRPGSLLDIKV